MNKLEFINELGEKLSLLPPGEVSGILDYYVESIDDRVEDGMDEEAAIASLGSLDDLAAKILSEQESLAPPTAPEPPKFNWEVAPEDAPPPPPPEPEPKKRRMSPGIIVLLVLGSPVWLSLLLGLGCAAFGIWIAVWAVLGSLFIAAAAMAFAGVIGGIFSFFVPASPSTFAVRLLASGSCLAVAGVGLFLLPLSLWLIRGFAHLHTLPFRGRKEAL